MRHFILLAALMSVAAPAMAARLFTIEISGTIERGADTYRVGNVLQDNRNLAGFAFKASMVVDQDSFSITPISPGSPFSSFGWSVRQNISVSAGATTFAAQVEPEQSGFYESGNSGSSYIGALVDEQISPEINNGCGYCVSWFFQTNGTTAFPLDVFWNGGSVVLGNASNYELDFSYGEGSLNLFFGGPFERYAQGRLTNRSGPITISVQPLVAAVAVPEPSTWLAMIIGFGVVGSALRRRAQGVVARI